MSIQMYLVFIHVIYVQKAALSGNVIFFNQMCSKVGDLILKLRTFKL